jgi:hypothetical protein
MVRTSSRTFNAVTRVNENRDTIWAAARHTLM